MASCETLIPEMDHPILFKKYSEERKEWEITEEARDYLKQIKVPIAPLAIIGQYRTGKSYLLNRLAGRRRGFALGPTMQRETQGIWMWAIPHPKQKNTCLLLLDTEGLGDIQKSDKENDMQIFTLSLLNSSCIIFNIISRINEALLHELQLVSEITEHIKVESDQEEESGSAFKNYLPKLVIVMRDVFLDFKVNGEEVDAQGYLEYALKSKPGASKKTKMYNAPRDCIKLYFPERHLFDLPRPVSEEEDLRSLDRDDVKPKKSFEKKLYEATEQILDIAKPMKLDGNVLNGERYLELCTFYVDAMNARRMPCLHDAIEAMVMKDCESASHLAFTLYNENMKGYTTSREVLDDDALAHSHQESYGKALALYKREAAFDPKNEYLTNLQCKLDAAFDACKEQNQTRSLTKSREAIEQCFAELEKELRDTGFMYKGGYSAFKSQMDAAERQYRHIEGLGSEKDRALCDYLAKMNHAECTIIAADKAIAENDKAHIQRAEETRQEDEWNRVKQLEDERHKQEDKRKIEELAKLLQGMEDEWAIKQQELKQEYDHSLRRMKEELDQVKKTSEESAEEYQRLYEERENHKHAMDDQAYKKMISTVLTTLGNAVITGLKLFTQLKSKAGTQSIPATWLEMIPAILEKIVQEGDLRL